MYGTLRVQEPDGGAALHKIVINMGVGEANRTSRSWTPPWSSSGRSQVRDR